MTSGGTSFGIKIVALFVIIQGLAGCTVNFRSANAIDRQSLADIHVGESREDVERVLGRPGEYGVRLKNAEVYKAAGYMSYSGTASIGKVEMKAVGANAFYQNDQLVELEAGHGSAGSVKAYSDIANKLKGKLDLGKADMNAIIALIGDPQVSGRFLRNRDAYNDLEWIVSTKNALDSYIQLRFDESGLLSSVAIYADHDPNMLSLFADEFVPTLKMVDFKGMYSSKHEAKREGDDTVRQLLATKPENVVSVIEVLGKPNAVGIYKSVTHPSPLLISLWSTMKTETKVVPDKDGHVMLVQTEGFILEIKHDVQGRIKEMTWIPYK